MNRQTMAALEYISNLHEHISKLQEKIKSLENDIERKNKLLNSALETLLNNEYVIDLGVIVEIEKEFGIE
jgi:peptidoglycan hydrolase CwlO-like protein